MVLDSLVRREAYVLAYIDAFWVVAWILAAEPFPAAVPAAAATQPPDAASTTGRGVGPDDEATAEDNPRTIIQGEKAMKREIIRVEPFDTNFEKWGAPVSTCTRAGDLIFISGRPPFDPATGELLVNAPFETQAERILEQLKAVLETAGSDLDHVMKCNVLCISAERFRVFNEIYKRYFPKNPPARIFFCVPQWTGPFDIEIDCVAIRKE